MDERYCLVPLFLSIFALEFARFLSLSEALKQSTPYSYTMLRLTSNQRAIWFDQLVNHNSALYNLGGFVRIEGPQNFEAIHRALKLCIENSDIFSLDIKSINGEPTFEYSQMDARINQYDFRSESNPEEACLEEMRSKHREALLWNEGELYQFDLYRISDNVTYWHIKVHHVLIDGWGVSVLVKRVSSIYESLIKEESPCANFPQFSMAAEADVAYENSEHYQQDKQYWKDHFKSLPSPISFPEPVPGHDKQTGSFRKSFHLSWEQYEQINELARSNKQSTFHLFIASIYAYCARAYHSEDFCIGLPILNRSSKAFKETIGLFTGISPLRIQADTTKTILEVGQQIRQQLKQNFRHQRFPLNEIIRETGTNANQGQSLFDIMFSFEKHDYDVPFGKATTLQEALPHADEKTPLAIYVREYGSGEEVKVDLDFRSDLWDDFHATQLLSQLKNLLTKLDKAQIEPIKSVPILSEDEKILQINKWNSSGGNDFETSIIKQYYSAFTSFKENMAVCDEQESLTYEQLETHSNQFAHLLREKGVQKGDVVAIRTDRSVNTIVSILAILKTGAAYLPIDSNYPKERQDYMAENAHVKFLLSPFEEELNDKYDVLSISTSTYSSYANLPVQVDIEPSDLAYIIYTSGSTGKPKGVMVTHGGSVNQSMIQSREFGVVPEDRCLLFSSLSFDSSVAEIFMSIFRGACLFICPEETRKTPSKFEAYLRDKKITYLTVTPSYLSLLRPEAFVGVRALLTGGEAVKRKVIKEIASYCDHFNVYGPTENSVVSSFYKFKKEVNTGVNMPIGKPIDATQIFILGKNQDLLPVGSTGELYLGGIQLAKGYINNPEETQKRFIDSPFKKGEKLYRTGDLGKYLPDGNIVYLGRVDDQVKLRGFRIETGEIENCLVEHPAVSNAGVILKQDQQGEGYLAAFYSTVNECSEDELSQHLSETLPEFMIPSRWMHLEKMPLSVNGKVDRKALREIELESANEVDEYIAPVTTLEKWLASTWEEMLDQPQLGLTSNFFRLGGHSLKAAQLLARIEREHNKTVPLSLIFEKPILKDFALAIENLQQGTQFSIPERAEDSAAPLTPSQKSIWIAEKLNEGKAAFNIPVAVVLKGTIDQDKLQQSFEKLKALHPALALTFAEVNGEVFQTEKNDNEVRIDLHQTADLHSVVQDYIHYDFDLENGPLFKIGLVPISDSEQLLLISIHHLISDGWSVNVLLRDLEKLYTDQEVKAPEVKFSDFAHWQADSIEDKSFANAKSYWEKTRNNIPSLSLPYDKPKSHKKSFAGKVKRLSLPQEFASQVHAFCEEKGLSTFMFVQTITKLMLHKISKSTDFALGSPVSGRSDSNLQDTLGLFVQTLPLRSSINPEVEVNAFLQQIKEETLDALNHQHFPVDALTTEIKASNKKANLFDVLISMDDQNFDKNSSWMDFDHPRIKELQLDYQVSKFDLSFSFLESKEGMDMHLMYSTELFTPETIELFSLYWTNIAETVLSNAKQRIVDIQLAKGSENAVLDYLGLDKNIIERAFPLTAVQRDMYLTSELAPNEGALRTLGYLFVRNELDSKLWKKALENLTAQESILRTTTIEKNGVAYQAVRKSNTINFEYLDFSDKNYSESDAKALVIEHCELTQDVHQELIHHWLFKFNDELYVSVLSGHHMLLDGSSFSYFYELLDGFYMALAENKDHVRNPYTSPFYDFANDIEFRFDRPEMQRFWSEHLKGVEPLNYRATLTTESNHVTDHIDMSEELSTQVKKYCKENRIRPDLYFKGLVALVVRGVCAAETDFCLRENLFGRSKSNLNTLGCFMSTKPLRIYQNECDSNSLFPEFCKAIKQEGIRSKDAGNISVSAQNRIIGNEPLSFYFNFQKFLEPAAELNMSYLYQVFHVMKEQVEIRVGENNTGFDFRLDYDESVFNGRNFMQRMIYLSEQLVKGAATIGDLRWTLPEEQNQIETWSKNEKPFAFVSVLDQYFKQLQSSKDKIAVRSARNTWTYQDLEEKSNQIANEFKAKGLQKGDRVALICTRDSWMLAGVLASMKTGGVYIPIDDTLPKERIEYILQNSEAKIIASDSPEWSNKKEVLNLNDSDPFESKFEAVKLDADNSAYIIYTSGTTGVPKGVEVQHGALSNISQAWTSTYELNKLQPQILQLASFSFDVCTGDFVRSMCNGGSMFICPKDLRLDPSSLHALIEEHDINMFEGTPGLVGPLMKHISENKLSLKSLELLIIGSDSLSTNLYQWIQKEFGKQMRVINSYGVTEACIDSACFEGQIEASSTCRTTPIGSPLANTEFAVLDGRMQMVAPGIPGELFIAGSGLAKGYVQNEELTNKRFISISGKKFYATGDQVRWLLDGSLEFLERTDKQVKVRGYRIELSEIEQVILESEQIKNVVLSAPLIDGHRELIAYFIPKNNFELQALKKLIQNKLPDYMLPQHFVQVDAFPLTNNGKIDFDALPSISQSEISSSYVAPQTSFEKKLAQIWGEVLNREEIGLEDNFFELGGHSLKATQLISEIQKQLQVSLPLSLLFKHPRIADLIAHWPVQSKEVKSIGVAPKAEYHPLSSAQMRTFLLQQMDENSTAYNMPAAFEIEGELEVDKLKTAFEKLNTLHDVLRTSFHLIDGVPMQKIHEDLKIGIDCSNEVKASPTELMDEFIRPFDLQKEPLFRVQVNSSSEHRHLLMFDMHHIIADGVTVQILVKDLMCLYSGENLTRSTIQYKDYAVYQQVELQESFEDQRKYWLEQFADGIPKMEFPTTKNRPNALSGQGSRLRKDLPGKLGLLIKELGLQNSLTNQVILQSTWLAFLYRYTGKTELVLGNPVAGRSLPETQDMAGMFVNTLPIYYSFDKQMSFKDILTYVGNKNLEALENQDYPFEKLVEDLQIKHDRSHHPIFDLAFSYLKPEIEKLSLGELKINQVNLSTKTSKFDLLTEVVEIDNHFQLELEYSTDLFDEEFIEQLANDYLAMMEALLQDPTKSISEANYLSIHKQQEIILASDNSSIEFPSDALLQDLFAKQVAKHPKKTALSFRDQHMSYEELDARANLIASHLPKGGAKIALLFDRGFEMLASILAVLKSGNCYVPVDPQYPQERIEYIIEDSQAKILLHDQNQIINSDLEKIQVFTLKEEGNNPLDYAIPPTAEAYVIYTSGSTGKPKGVPISHQNVVRLFFNDAPLFDFSEQDVWTLFHSYCFDFSVWEMYGAMLYGGELVIVDTETAKDPSAYVRLVDEKRVSILNQTPGAFYNFASLCLSENVSLKNLKQVIFGGEALQLRQLKSWNEKYPQVSLINMYGITETTVHVTFKEITPSEIDKGWSNIGTPIPTLGMLVLDEDLRIVPKGVVGELCVYGAGLSNGYLNREELTAEKFVDHPFKKGEKLYRSGDLARLRENGEFEYIGRKDEQVKIRGYRIETGEIENAILENQQVVKAAVIAHQDAQSVYYLAAYFTGSASIKTVKAQLENTLPVHMVPTWFVPMNELPLTSNGKLNRKALPIPHLEVQADDAVVKPQNNIEECLLEIWTEVLGTASIGCDQGFFDVGGHSLAAAKIVGKIHERLESTIELKDLFSNPSIQALAKQINQSQGPLVPVIEPVRSAEFYPCSSAEQRLFVIHQMDPKQTTYNIPGVFEIEDANFQKSTLESAFLKLMERHEILRTNYFMEGNKVWRKISDQARFELADLETNKTSVNEVISDFVRPFDLENECLFRVAVTKIDHKQYLLFDIHHIICDEVSMENLLKDLGALYLDKTLSDLPISYKDFASWQKTWMDSKAYLEEKEYWMNQFAEEVPALNMPTDFVRPPIKSHEGARYHFQIPPALGLQIRALAQEFDASPFAVFLSAYKLLIAKYSGQTDIVVGTPVSGRTNPQLNPLLGMFVNTLALRDEIKMEQSFSLTLNSIRQHSFEALSKQNYPFEDLIDALDLQRDMSRNPLFDFMFSYQHETQEEIQLSDSKFKAVNFEHPISKMDITLDVNGKAGGGFDLSMEFATRLYRKKTIVRMASHLNHLLKQIVKNPNQELSKYQLATPTEKNELLYGFNNTLMDFRRNLCIGGLFEEQADLRENELAIVDNDKQWTYADLEKSSNRIASQLAQFGLKPNARVTMRMERSAELIATQIGILRAGMTYVYLDPNLPEDRVSYILNDCQAGLLITKDKLNITHCAQRSFEELNIETDEQIKSKSAQRDLAYIIYTSGTTGMPKGVAVEQKSVLNLAHWFANAYNMAHHRNILQMTNMSFDVAVEETLVPLMYGACVHIASREVVLDQDAFANFIEDRQIDIAQFVPSTLEKLIAENRFMSSLKILICGGERLNSRLKKQVMDMGYELYNHYGPTETTVDSLVWKCSGHNARLVSKRVEARAKKTPDKIAVASKHGELSYASLHDRAERMAAYLQSRGVQKGDIIAISIERSIELVEGILGIMKAGAAYLPIDSNAPKGRVEYMLNDSQAKFLLTKTGIHEEIEFEGERLDILNPNHFQHDLVLEPVGLTTEDLAYVIYTSGSTGNPKGVQIEHASLNNFLQTTMAQYANGFGEDDVCLGLTNISFDVSVCEIFIALVHGAKLFMLDRMDVYDINLLTDTIVNEEISFAYIPPSLLQDVHDKLLPQKEKLKFNKLMVGVEPIRDHVLQAFKELHPNMLVMNSYGPTESTIYCTSLDVPATQPEGNIVPIGRPIFNTQIYILNEQDQLQPVGVPGELCIAGEGLARGYLNKPELTAEKFTSNPFAPGKRMYRTGDIARWLPDGTIEFVGRKDFQVKIRGFRIEPGEIENQLLILPQLKQVLVLALEDHGEKYLCAYYTLKEEISEEEMKKHLAQSLPDYMIPEHFVKLDFFPLTKNEKVDRNALPVPERSGKTSSAEFVDASNETEKTIQAWWKETLEMEQIGINDNFFELGGNSLKIIGLFGKMKEAFPEQIAVNDLFDKPTIRLQAAHIDAQKHIEDKTEDKPKNKRPRRVEF